MKGTKWALFAIIGITAANCNDPKKKTRTGDIVHTVFVDKNGMDTNVSPGEDFFLYANGKWLRNTKIPLSETDWGPAYQLQDDNQKRLQNILTGLAKQHNDEGSITQKVADFYQSGMDTTTIEKLGYEPVKPLLAKIKAINNRKGFLGLSADGYRSGDGFLIGFSVSPDDRNSDKNMAHFDQDGLNLPDRDFYLSTDTSRIALRKAYQNYIITLFTYIGETPAGAAKKADNVLKIETAIARMHLTPVELRDPIKNYHKYIVSELQKQLPDIDLKVLFRRMDIHTDTVLVGQPKYYTGLNSLLQSQPLDVWKDKLAFDVLNRNSPNLSKKFRDAHFNFFGKKLYGQQQQKMRWKDMVSAVDHGLGELLGQLYAEKYFTSDAKKRMLQLVNNLQGVYKVRIEKLDWMSPETKTKALQKLSTFTKKIGYPDKWKNYDDVKVNPTTYFDNLKSIAKHHYKASITKLDKSVDKSEWRITTPTVNAYYTPQFNEIVFPAGILQFPFFDKNADDAINYGAIGATIGHEMTHGFDDQGRQYDAAGNLEDWWTPADAKKFKSKTQVLISQYDRYTILDNLHINGSLTLGENLADLGGVAIAYQAFKNTQQSKRNEKIDGFTPDQRFFLSFAQSWRVKSTEESMRLYITTDPHSPEIFRVNGTVSNMPAFYKAFDIKSGDRMFLKEKERVRIW